MSRPFCTAPLHGISGPPGKGSLITDGHRAHGFSLFLPVGPNGRLLFLHAAGGAGQESLIPGCPVRKDHHLPAAWAGKIGRTGGDESVENTLGKIQELPDLVYTLIRLPIKAVGFLTKGVLVGVSVGHENSPVTWSLDPCWGLEQHSRAQQAARGRTASAGSRVSFLPERGT